MLLNVLVLLAYCGLVSGYLLSHNVHRRVSSLSCQPSVTSSTPLTAQQGTKNRLNNFAVGTAALLTAQLVSTGLRVNAAEVVAPTSSSPIVVLGEFIGLKCSTHHCACFKSYINLSTSLLSSICLQLNILYIIILISLYSR